MISKLPERVYGDQVRCLQRDLHTLILRVGRFSARSPPSATSILQETKWLAPLSPPPFQPLLGDDRTSRNFIDCKMVGDQWLVAAFTVLQLDRYRAGLTTCLQFPSPGLGGPRRGAARIESTRTGS